MEESGTKLLKRPVSPLMFFLTLIFFAGDYQDIGQLIDEIPDQLTIKGLTYEKVRQIFGEYLDILRRQNALKPKKDLKVERIVIDPDMRLIDLRRAIALSIKHSIVARELGKINSLLCPRYKCVECCRGPHNHHKDYFFELPLSPDEISLFNVPRVDNASTRSSHAFAEPSPVFEGKEFYLHPPAIYNWNKGWSLILPRETYCPNLDVEKGKCIIYQKRPEVCRLPQIFPLVLERHYDPKAVSRFSETLRLSPSDLKDSHNIYIAHNGILGILDCPYVREFQHEIVDYAALSGLKAFFRRSKK